MEINLPGYVAFINVSNGSSLVIPKNNKESMKDEIDFFLKDECNISCEKKLDFKYETIMICLNLTKKCNLSCRYCFNKSKSNISLSLSDAINYIDYVIQNTSYAGKYIVDLSGSGEPLMEFDNILSIAEYCYKKSNEIKKHIMPQFVCNGTLLSRDKVDLLQKNNVLFGVSLDGKKKINDKNRIDFIGKSTFKKVINNVKAIKHKDYVGVAVTLNNDNLNIVSTLKFLKKYFNTISIKIFRPTKEYVLNVDKIKEEYIDLNSFLIDRLNRGDLSYILCLLNGDDFYGKYLVRVLFNVETNFRCDAGVGKFSIDSNLDIYVCSGAVGDKKLCVGSLKNGIDFEKAKVIHDSSSINNQCSKCSFLKICGGECLVVKNINEKVNPQMCEIKQLLIKLALHLKGILIHKFPNAFKIILDFCNEKNNRSYIDKELLELANTNNQYTFMQLKYIKDNDYEMFEKIKKATNIIVNK